jgi:cardiolipin synthase
LNYSVLAKKISIYYIPGANAGYTSGHLYMKLELLVDSAPFRERLREDISKAHKRIYLQTLSFEGDSVGRELADEIIASDAVDKKIIIDCYTKYVLSDKFIYSPKNIFDSELRRERKATAKMVADMITDGTSVKFINPAGPLLVRFAGRNHKKIIVIDDSISFIGGINFSEHNFHWHDMMIRIDSPEVADYLAHDFNESWAGRHYGGHKDFGLVTIHSLDGINNTTAYNPILGLIDQAKKSIYVQSPYLSFPFSDRLRDASRRGVSVTAVTPEFNNKKLMGSYIRWEAARSAFDLWLYPHKMTHLKAMLIDEKYLIAGSSNFDCFSNQFFQETVAVITDKDLIENFKVKVIEADFRVCRKLHNPGLRMSGYLRNLQIRSIGRLFSLLYKR